ncbi:MAG: LytTR family transcriptional regulator DNA-binding domain-containing protein [Lachnospiraceae bacterium]|nr:LytTR family transcriptional regulator DNA-binding domain-containing protein [Lachnospiraceae bacterium]
MKIDIKKTDGEEEKVVVRYSRMTPLIKRIIDVLSDEGGKIWGKADGETVSILTGDILYVESVDDKTFAYTNDKIVRIEETLNSFIDSISDDSFFRCSKSMIINVNHVVSLKSLSSNRIDATIEGGEHIIISRRYASEFRRLLRGDR